MCCPFLCRSFSLSFISFSSNQAATLDFLSTAPSQPSLLTLSPSAILCTSIVTTSVLHQEALGTFLGFLHPIPLQLLEEEVEDCSRATGAAWPAGQRAGNAWGFVTCNTSEFPSLWVEEAVRCESFFRVPLEDQAAACPLEICTRSHAGYLLFPYRPPQEHRLNK